MTFLCNRYILKHIYFAQIQTQIPNGICLYGATMKANLDTTLREQKSR